MRFLTVLAACSLVAACGQQTEVVGPDDAAIAAADAAAMSDADSAAADAAAMADLRKAEASSLTAEDKGRVCRAAIASLNGRDPAIIRVISTNDDIHRVRYTRDDATIWTNECRVGDGTAEWRTVENGQPGRWRAEDTIRFTVNGSTISINTLMGGEPMTSDTYEVE